MFSYLKDINNLKDRFFLSLMVFTICEQTIFVFPILYATRILGIESFFSTAVTLIYIVLILGAISTKRLRYITPFTWVVIVFFFMSILCTYYFFPECSEYLDQGWDNELKSVIPWFLLGTCFYADKISMDTIGKWCSIGVIFLSWYLLVNNNQLDEGEYDMHASYRLLLSILITINHAFISKSRFAIVASLIGVIYAFAMGTRGPVVVILVFTGLLFAQNMLEKGKNRWWQFVLLGLGVLTIASISTLPILEYLQELFMNLGFSTRFFDLAISDQVLQDSSRQMIYDTLINRMYDNPMPHGLYSVKLSGFFSAHNIYLEILYEYGIFLGCMILLGLFSLVVFSYCKTTNLFAKRWILMFICYVFIHGFFGGRFLANEVFFMIGFCMKEIQFKNIITNNGKKGTYYYR